MSSNDQNLWMSLGGVGKGHLPEDDLNVEV